ncbi:MAG: WYL domain-containing protein [Propionibacteriaceae bacterium]|nr:WYL domain-containing protein [Propionibacteriaceae bacterium]
MSKRKTERLFNLTVALLTTRNYVTKNQIRGLVEGYDQHNTVAFERQFERDKDELRALGIPIVTGHNDAWFEDEPGYRIPRSDFELPEVEFSADELTVLGVAATVWRQRVASERTAGALVKLRAAGMEPDVTRLGMLAPQLAANEPAFEPLWDALASRQEVRFGYRGQPRRVQPWQLVSRHGSWYLIGHDLDRGEARVFKLARFDSQPRPVGKKEAFVPPAPEEIREHTLKLRPAEPTMLARVALAPGLAPELRRRGRPTGEWHGQDEVYEVDYASDEELVAEVCAAGAAALLLAPTGLREAVVARLKAVLG